MKDIIMTCGIPGCGKSTWALGLQNYHGSDRCKIVSTDAIRYELYGDESIQGDGQLVFETAFKKIEAYLNESDINIVVFDATNLHMKNRINFLKRFHSNQVKVTAVYFDVPLEIAKDRNSKRDRKVPDKVINRMYHSMEIPTSKEGFDEIIVVHS